MFIPERQREALMRLTMCAREECGMCKYEKRCNFDFQYEIATENMNILADALRVEQIEPQTEKSNKVQQEFQQEPQDDCSSCTQQADCPWK